MQAERDAYELRVAALAPKVEAMEASWNRISSISGAQTSEEVIAYWVSHKDWTLLSRTGSPKICFIIHDNLYSIKIL
jgi:hypothetical protein